MTVLDAALAQIPDAHRHGTGILIRTDSAGGAKVFLAHLRNLPGRLRRQPLVGADPQGPTASAGGEPGHEVAGHAAFHRRGASGETLLATHPRAVDRGVRVVEEAHCASVVLRMG